MSALLCSFPIGSLNFFDHPARARAGPERASSPVVRPSAPVRHNEFTQPPSAGQVLLTHVAGNYPEGKHSFNETDSNGEGVGNVGPEHRNRIGDDQFYPLNIKRSIAIRGSINTSD